LANSPRNNQQHRAILQRIAHRAMIERGLLPEFSAAARAELDRLQAPAFSAGPGPGDGAGVRDLRDLLWASIDNDDSRDLDQLTVADSLSGGVARIRVAVADVDALVRSGSAIDVHARHNTTSVYTAAEIFPMLPERLSTDLTSLNFGEERRAMVVDMVVGPDGVLQSEAIYPARVRNRAKLAYNGVAAWLEGHGEAPDALTAVTGLAENLRLQDRVAQSLRNSRHAQGALSLQTIQTRPVFERDELRGLEVDEKNRAKEIIEDFMIAANGVTARYLEAKGRPSIRRVVRTPKRWDRIVELARTQGTRLSDHPDARALDAFLVAAQAADPMRFPDLSLAVIKLLGSGEYVAEQPGSPAPGHFGLAVQDYAHSTAPNRRYADLLTQRLLKAAIAGGTAPYAYPELDALATHLTAAEDAANKVERQVAKSAAALLLESRIGDEFDALVTGASEKGTWARLLSMPVEGRVERGFEGLDVGDRIRVRLLSVDVERGFIDFGNVRGARR
jgi:VacB/RNase II family 3'-5' exoribonuclease